MLTVTRDPSGEDGLISIPISSICFLQYASHFDRVVVHTQRSEYYLPGTLKYWTKAFNASGFCFYLADRSASINVDNVISIDRNFLYVNFDELRKKRCSVAFHKINKTAKAIQGLNSRVIVTPAII